MHHFLVLESNSDLSKQFFILGLNKLAIQLESKQAHTSFGKLPLSVEPTAPNFGFGKAKREDQSKVFIGDLTVLENMGKGSPAPTYMYDDKVKYKDVCNGFQNNDYRLLNSRLGLRFESVKKSPSMIFTKTLFSWMTLFRRTITEDHVCARPRSELSLVSTQSTTTQTLVLNTW